MKLIILPIIALFTLTACTENPDEAGRSSSGEMNFTNICIDGVTYVTYKLKFRTGVMTVKLDRDSKIIPCTNSDLAPKQ